MARPHTIASDKGIELTVWRSYAGPRSAMSSGITSSARLQGECLDETIFTSLALGRQVLEAWRHDYNHFRPRSSLGKDPVVIGEDQTANRTGGMLPHYVSPSRSTMGIKTGQLYRYW
ncbi:integrase core domain-containing protein [Aurantiacibacter zhengii]|uniref:integrase core domain-containing protein n=1 Tax=Aurantiacibacter zhengii TaxID=2307003 RepID=UPI0038990317